MNIIQEKAPKKLKEVKHVTVKPQVIGKYFFKSTSKFETPQKTPALSCKSLKMDVPSSTSRSKSTPVVNKDCHVIASICEGRGKESGIVGIAAINIHRPVLILSQISDTQTYTETLTKLNILQPVEVLVPVTFVENVVGSRLPSVLVSHFPNMAVTTMPRSEFNRSLGLHYLSTLCASAFNAITLQIEKKFYVTAAICALFRYIEQSRSILYAPKTIKVEYQGPEDATAIDVDTADLLNLVSSPVQNQPNLYSILNTCSTSLGRRLLRTNILQPPCRRQLIETRLDCIQEMVENPQLLMQLSEALKPLADIEQALVFGTVLPATANNVSERQLNYTLQLKGLLLNVPPLINELGAAKHPFFRQIYTRLVADDDRSHILKIINNVINDDAHLARGHAGEIQRCYSLKSGLDDFLDLKRRVYSEVIDKMRIYVNELSTTHALPLRVQNTFKNGFHIILPLTAATRSMKTADLPQGFINVERFSNHFSLTTMDMINFDKRLKNTSMEIQSMSNIIIHKLLTEIRPYISSLYQLCDDIGQLDLLVVLALHSTAPNYIRPEFSNSHMDIVGARHPLLERICSNDFQSNDLILYPRNNMHIITGPNMSGKSIYIRSIVLLQVMAQLGCWVPCTKAVFRVSNQIFTRIAIEDSIDGTGASSFAREMSKMSYLLSTVGPKSFVVLDELCRSTASEEGAALAFTICESLLKTCAFVIVATHFMWLTILADLYPNITVWNMETIEKKDASSTQIGLNYTYRVIPGYTNIEAYGIKLSKAFCYSKSISERAEQLYNFLLPFRKSISAESSPKNIEFIKYKLQAELDLLKIKKQLTPEIENLKIKEYEEKTGFSFENLNYSMNVKQSDQISSSNCQSSVPKEPCSSKSSDSKTISSHHVFSSPKSGKSYDCQQDNHIFSIDVNDAESASGTVKLSSENFNQISVSEHHNNNTLNTYSNKTHFCDLNTFQLLETSISNTDIDITLNTTIDEKLLLKSTTDSDTSHISVLNDSIDEIENVFSKNCNLTNSTKNSNTSIISSNRISEEKSLGNSVNTRNKNTSTNIIINSSKNIRLVSELYTSSESMDEDSCSEESFIKYLESNEWITSTPILNRKNRTPTIKRKRETSFVESQKNSDVNLSFFIPEKRIKLTKTSIHNETNSSSTNYSNSTVFGHNSRNNTISAISDSFEKSN